MELRSILKILKLHRLKHGQAGFQFSSFMLGMLVAVIVLGILGFGGLYFYAISYDDDYMITEEPEWSIYQLNRAQQAFYLKKGYFTSNINDLQGYPTSAQGHLNSSEYYVYSTQVLPKNAQLNADSLEAVISYGIPRQATIPYRNGVPLSLHSVVGAVFITSSVYREKDSDRNERIMVSILCQSFEPSNIKPATPQLENGLPVCGTATKIISP